MASLARLGFVRAETDYVHAADDPSRVVTVTAQSGKTGNEVIISYTNCKVVGNGSFGVVFAAKMLREWAALKGSTETGLLMVPWFGLIAAKTDGGSEEPETEIAIKKVLQDKRFKV